MNSNITSDFKELYNDTKKQVSVLLSLNDDKSSVYFILSLIIIIFIIFLVISWVFYTLSKKDAACKKLSIIYLDNSRHKTSSFLRTPNSIKSEALQKNNPINFFDNENKSLIKNYYIKTAYNACCGDGYKNNFVNICALEKCIQIGARCLDFEIYSMNKQQPVVAVSKTDSFLVQSWGRKKKIVLKNGQHHARYLLEVHFDRNLSNMRLYRRNFQTHIEGQT
mgnify:CR=1 FL=1